MPDALRSQFDFARARNWTEAFSRFDVRPFARLFEREGESFWQKEGERRALRVFHEAARRVPAYRDFLRRNKVRHELVKTAGDFANVPPTDKWNYVKAYPLEKRLWDGAIGSADIVAVSSGTSGEPTFWPRGGFQEFEAAVVHELLYRAVFGIEKRKTLLIIGFPMGVYVSGVATVIPSWLVSQKPGYDLTVVTAGNDKASVLRVAAQLGKKYDQVVLVGHPFFVKDVVESGIDAGVRWRDMRVRMMFCSEGFSEAWREYVVRKARGRFDPGVAINTYGSSEFLLMAYETPLTVTLRRALERSGKLRSRLFGNAMLPNLFQYNPFLRYVESVNEELLFTSASGVPLIRFNLHDSGRVLPFGETMRAAGMGPRKRMWQLPFLAMWGRSDYTIIFYAANIYPEHVRGALDRRPFLGKLTGKFTMQKGYLRNMDEFLEINIELRKGIKVSRALAGKIQSAVIGHLEKVNMEYLFLRGHLDKDIRPRVTLWPYQHEKYFKVGLKPRYIIRDE